MPTCSDFSWGWYGWWFRNPANQLRLVVYLIIYMVSCIPRWCRISAINSMSCIVPSTTFCQTLFDVKSLQHPLSNRSSKYTFQLLLRIFTQKPAILLPKIWLLAAIVGVEEKPVHPWSALGSFCAIQIIFFSQSILFVPCKQRIMILQPFQRTHASSKNSEAPDCIMAIVYLDLLLRLAEEKVQTYSTPNNAFGQIPPKNHYTSLHQLWFFAKLVVFKESYLKITYGTLLRYQLSLSLTLTLITPSFSQHETNHAIMPPRYHALLAQLKVKAKVYAKVLGMFFLSNLNRASHQDQV